VRAWHRRGCWRPCPGKVADAAREWERHLTEVETGLPPGAGPGTAPKPEFDPVARTLTERAQAKADELGVTLRTVERMLRRYRDQGLWGLVDTEQDLPLAVCAADDGDGGVVAAVSGVGGGVCLELSDPLLGDGRLGVGAGVGGDPQLGRDERLQGDRLGGGVGHVLLLAGLGFGATGLWWPLAFAVRAGGGAPRRRMSAAACRRRLRVKRPGEKSFGL
jgi:hypothetical protein